MSLVVNWKFIFVAVFIFMYNVWLNLFGYLAYSTYKVVEYYLEIVVRYLFGVGEHASEIIVFYFFFFLGLCLFAYLWTLSPRIYRCASVVGGRYKQQFLEYWKALALLEKFKLSMLYTFTSFSFVFLMF